MVSGGKKLGWLLLLIAAVYLAGNGRTPLFDRDEPRYAQCSRQMLQSGDWVVPRLYDKLRTAKPPGIYWCQATAMSVMGDNAFAARFPSALATLGVCLLLGLGVRREMGTRHGVWTVFILASTILMLFAGKNCLTDAVLLLCITTALGCIYLLWQGRGGWTAVIVLAVAIGCGGLVKGPFILGVLAATLIALTVFAWLDRWSRGKGNDAAGDEEPPPHSSGTGPSTLLVQPARTATKPTNGLDVAVKCIVGILIVAALVLPWLYLVQHRAPQFLHAAKADAVAHLETGSEGHSGKPGYHFLLVWVTYLPWSLLLPMAVVTAVKNWRVPQVRFALAVVLGTWVFVEILQTKLPHYLLPAFPALAFLTAYALIPCLDGERDDLVTRVNSIVLGIASLLFLAIAVGPWWLAIRFDERPNAGLILLTACVVLYAVSVSSFFFARRPGPAVVTMGAGALVLAAVLFGVYLPHCQPIRLPARVADVLKANGAIHPHDAVMFEYKEPSLAFYQGGTIREYDDSLQQLASSAALPRFAVIPTWVWNQATPQTRNAFEIIAGPLAGWDYSDNGKTANVLVLKRKQ